MSKATDTQRRALGKGLSALLPNRQPNGNQPPPPKEGVRQPAPISQPREEIPASTLPIDWIHPNPHQPRQNFDEDRIGELAQSIRANGIIQPITVCEVEKQRYLIVAGERRWRAAKLAGLTSLPVYVRKVDQANVLELALIENIQREDLNPIETGEAFEELIVRHKLTHEQIAERTGKDRSTVTNFLRLLKLSPEVRQHVATGQISMGHARALLSLDRLSAQLSACERIIKDGLSVRATEQLIKRMTSAPEPARELKKPRIIDANTRAALDEMAMALGTKVKIVPRSDTSGKLEVEYYSKDDLQRIYEAIVSDRP
jgi:ParB family transcriptional regulator, chromosome partitioning protein